MNSKTTRKMNKVPSYMKNIGNAKAQVVRWALSKLEWEFRY